MLKDAGLRTSLASTILMPARLYWFEQLFPLDPRRCSVSSRRAGVRQQWWRGWSGPALVARLTLRGSSDKSGLASGLYIAFSSILLVAAP